MLSDIIRRNFCLNGNVELRIRTKAKNLREGGFFCRITFVYLALAASNASKYFFNQIIRLNNYFIDYTFNIEHKQINVIIQKTKPVG